jgi:hypothetical protein
LFFSSCSFSQAEHDCAQAPHFDLLKNEPGGDVLSRLRLSGIAGKAGPVLGASNWPYVTCVNLFLRLQCRAKSLSSELTT